MCVANAIRAWHAMGRRFPWCIRFNSWMRPFAASRSNRCGDNPFPQNRTRRGCRFSWRCRATPQRQAKSRGRHFCGAIFLLRVQGRRARGPFGAGSGFGGAKDADVIVNLTLEGIPVDETVDLQGPKRNVRFMADAALWNFLAESERRRERPPIRAAENTAKDVHHNGQAVALCPPRVAIRTSGKRSAPPATMSSGLVWRGLRCRWPSPRESARRADAPFRFFRRRQRGGHVNHDGRLFLAGETDGNGVSASMRSAPHKGATSLVELVMAQPIRSRSRASGRSNPRCRNDWCSGRRPIRSRIAQPCPWRGDWRVVRRRVPSRCRHRLWRCWVWNAAS